MEIPINLDLRGENYHSAVIELLIKSLAHQKAIISLLCDKYGTTQDEADSLYSEAMVECDSFAKQIMEDLYARKGHVDPDSLS